MRVVLVGGFGHGHQHLQVWRKHPDVTALTVVGRNAERLATLAAEYGVAVHTDLGAVVGDADLVDICTPTDTHDELTRVALAAGRPTVVEKPPCRTADEARALRELAGATPLFCVLNYRFSPLWRRVRELVAWGSIGRPRLALWPVLADNRHLMSGDQFRADSARGGGALLDGAFHLVDLNPWVLGRPLRAVTAWLGRLAAEPPAGEDTALVVYDYDGGVAQLTYSWAVANPPRTPAATLVGDEATLLVPRSAKHALELVRDRATTEVDLGQYRSWSRNDLSNCLYHYVDCLAGRAQPECGWDDALHTQLVVEATEQAAADGTRRAL
jgi:predicted dehydrogenase